MRIIFATLLLLFGLISTCTGAYVLIDGALQAVVRHYAAEPRP